jgi:hypothetical protein
MTISSTTRIAGPFVGNGTASVFPFTFKVFAAADLDVVRLTTSTGVETTLVLNSNYSVTLNGDQNSNPGGSITLLAGALATGYTLVITSDIANLQPTDLTNQGGFYPEVITDALDRATIQIQQISDIGDRTLKIPITDGSLNMELPPAAERANTFLSFDANGLPSVVTAGSSGAPATITRQVFSGTGSQTVFTLASDPGALGNSAQVYIGGVYQQRSTYTIAGTTLTFSSAPVAGTGNIEFVNFLTSNIGATSADLVTYTPAGTGAVARSVASKFGDVVSVKDFGAVGDGNISTGAGTDNTAAFQAAINNSGANAAIYVPPGIYKLASQVTIPSGKTIFGTGGYSTILLAPAAFTADGLVKANGTGGPPTVIENMTVTSQTGGAGAGSIGINAAANGTIINNVWCAGFATNIRMASTDTFLNNSISEVARTGGTGIAIASEAVTVSDCIVYDCYVGMSVATGSFTAGVTAISNVRTSACTYAGFIIDTSNNVQLTNCSCTHNNTGRYTYAGISLSTATNVTINNFQARLGAGPSTTAHGIRATGSERIAVSCPTIEGFDDGMNISGGGAVNVIGGMFTNNNNRGIFVSGSAYAHVANNTCITNGSGLATNAGIYSDNSAVFAQHIISGNICTQATGGVQDYGIYANIVNNGASSGFTNIIGNITLYNAVANLSTNGVTANITSTGNRS